MNYIKFSFGRFREICLAVLLISLFSIGASNAQGPSPEFRTIDGTGNNEDNPTWGSMGIQLLRSTSAAYEDGISEPRGGDPSSLPSPREVSNDVVAQSGSVLNSVGVSDFVWQWGQFLDHDIDLTLIDLDDEFNIPVPTGDPIFDPTGTGTEVIPFERSIFDDTTGTGAGNPREQLNDLTAWIDASQVYGSDDALANALRSGQDGKLKTSSGNLLPPDPQNPDSFLAGDIRVNEHIGLTSMHTLFMREHNRLADLIADENPGMSDEEIYQRARAIVGAQIQVISYNEFLPLLLGQDALPPYAGYDDQVDGGIATEFSSAAYRVGHTMLSPMLLRLDDLGQEIANGHVPLREAFEHPDLIREDGIEPILRGLAVQSAQEIDTRLVDDVRNFLFPQMGGFDLASFNIQRGRDHGLAGYNDVREGLGLGRISDFADITSDPTLQSDLAAAYDDVDDIDLWVGGLAEEHLSGALVGETFHAILSDQFMRLRDGDRFWHEYLDWTSYGFDTDPVVHSDGTTLSDVTLAEIIGWNTNITSIQDNAFVGTELIVNSNHATVNLGRRVKVNLSGRARNVSRIQVTCQADPTVLRLVKVSFSSALTSQAHQILADNYDLATGTSVAAIELQSPINLGENLIGSLIYKGFDNGTTDITCDPQFTDLDGNILPASSVSTQVTVQ
ncbi:MAG: peroxidase family protein [Ardenticatenaceae bacterium]